MQGNACLFAKCVSGLQYLQFWVKLVLRATLQWVSAQESIMRGKAGRGRGAMYDGLHISKTSNAVSSPYVYLVVMHGAMSKA